MISRFFSIVLCREVETVLQSNYVCVHSIKVDLKVMQHVSFFKMIRFGSLICDQ